MGTSKNSSYVFLWGANLGPKNTVKGGTIIYTSEQDELGLGLIPESLTNKLFYADAPEIPLPFPVWPHHRSHAYKANVKALEH